MDKKRLSALTLALVLLMTLLPLSAFAEGEYGDGLIRLRFTAPGGGVLVTLIDETGNPVLPLSDEGMYLLSPGFYSYYAVDSALGELLVPVTPLPLDGSEAELEILIGAAAQPYLPAPAEAAEEPAEDTPAMPVIFRCSRAVDYAGLSVTSSDGAVMEPWMDPLTGRVQFENYLLLPGRYGFWYHDPAGRVPDQQGSFAVTASGMQYIELDFSDGAVEGCFSATAVNPYYANLISADYIPAPSISPEQSLSRLAAEVSPNGGFSMNTVYYATQEGAVGNARTSSPILYDTPETAGAALKRALIQRQTEISIRVKTHIQPTKEIWWDMCWMIYNEAIRHTGAPAEGDYLRYEYGGVNCNGSATGSEETNEYYYEFIYSPLYFTTLDQESDLNGRVASILDSLQLSGKSDEQKVRAVYAYLCDNVVYEQARDTLNFTAYSALVKGKAACQGVSVAFYRLCLELGLDARVVTSDEMGHAWNIVRVGGKNYYAADATWDIGRKPEEWKFCLRGRESWKAEHTAGDEFEDGSFDAYTWPNADYGASSEALIHSVSLLFDGLLRIKYYFILPESLMEEEGSVLCFSRGGETVQIIPLTEGRQEGDYTCFYCSVPAEAIDTPIQVRIRLADGSFLPFSTQDGTLFANGFFISPMEYARRMKTTASTASMRALAQTLEDYGTAAQNYFKNRSDELRDEVLAVRASDLDAWTIRQEGTKPDGFREASVSVMFEADNSLRVYLRFDEGAAPSDYGFRVDGRSAALRQKGEDSYYLSVENIAADALDTAHSFTVSDGTSSYTLTVSVLGYAKAAIERGSEGMANLGRALYLYNRAAENYFG